MIQSVNDFKFYVQEDSKWYITDKRKKSRLFSDEVWHYLISMRKLEYYTNCNGNMIKRLFWRWRFHILGIKLGFDIPLNTCGPGLCIRHWGCIVINPLAKLGSNCIIQQGVVIGRGNHFDDVPQIGDNCYIGPGAKLYGKIVIGNNNVIGANAVVNKSYKDENVIIAGIPAKITGKKNDNLR